MIKINEVVLNKIILQAEEAKDQGFTKLAEGVINSLDNISIDNSNYSYEMLQKELYSGMWKMAFQIIGYHDLESTDIQKLDETITSLSSNILKNIEQSLDVEGKVGPNDPPLFGQNK